MADKELFGNSEQLDDTISRQAAIDALDEQIRQCDKALSAFDISMKDEYAVKVERASLVAFRETLEYMPSAQPGWIPCTPETMPKEDGQYIVTVKYEHVDGYDDIYSEHGEWVDGHWDAECGHCGRVEKVLAWQPLPTPYREGEPNE